MLSVYPQVVHAQVLACHASLSKLFTNIITSAMTLYPGFLLVKCQVVVGIWRKVS